MDKRKNNGGNSTMTKQQMKGNLLKMLSDDEGREIKMSDIVIRFNGRFINLKNL